MLTRRTAIRLGAAAVAAAALPARGAERLNAKLIASSPAKESLPMIGIGTARRFDVATPEEREPLMAVLEQLPKLGGKLVDTAPSYGVAEQVVGELVAKLGNRKELFIATKVGAGRDGAEAGIAEMNRSQPTRAKMVQLLG